jgi:hypothetical protein
MKLLWYSCVGLAILLGFITIIAYTPCPDGRFTDMGDGTVRDEDSGLIWLKDANCSELAGTDSSGKADWITAIDVAAASLTSGICGLTDGSIAGAWRLPTQEEWIAFVDHGYINPAWYSRGGYWSINAIRAFTRVQSGFYWSSTEGCPDCAWIMGLGQGRMDYDFPWKTRPYYVWPVRSDN